MVSLIEAKWAIDKYLVNLLHFKMLNFTTRITPVHHPCQIVIKAIGVFRQAIVLYETFDGRLILGKKCSQSKCELGCTRVIKCSFSYESP